MEFCREYADSRSACRPVWLRPFRPVLWKAVPHCIHVAVGVCAIAFYAYLTVYPPAEWKEWCLVVGKPEKMAPITCAFMAGGVAVCLIRACWARASVLSSDAKLLSLLQDEFTKGKITELMESKARCTDVSLAMVVVYCCALALPLMFQIPLRVGLIVGGSTLPAFLIFSVFEIPTYAVMRQVQFICECKVEAMCKSLDDEAENEDTKAEFWTELTKRYLQFGHDLETLWTMKHGGGLVLLDVLLRAGFLAWCFVGAVVEDDNGGRVLTVIAAALCVGTILWVLRPLATITSHCRSSAAGLRSIMRLVAGFVNSPRMEREAKEEQVRFYQLVVNRPLGVELPGFGLVTMETIKYYAKLDATATPCAITYILKYVGDDDNTGPNTLISW